MSWVNKTLTRRVVAVAFFLLLAWELFALAFGEKNALITPAMIHFLAAYNSVGVLFGALIGHFVLLRRKWMPWPPPPAWGLGLLLGVLAVALGFDVFTHYRLYPEATVGTSVLLGHFFWAQEPQAPQD